MEKEKEKERGEAEVKELGVGDNFWVIKKLGWSRERRGEVR